MAACLIGPIALGSTANVTVTELQTEIRNRESNSFEPLLQRWNARYGSQAVAPLLRIASDRRQADPDRYIALMGAAKLGGSASAALITPFLKDPSWMIRSAGLRILAALKNPQTAEAVLPLLQDPALVVRLEAVEAVRKLNPAGAKAALLSTLNASANYHHGKAQWVPQKAIQALISLQARDSARNLIPLLDHEQDPDLQKQAISALRELTGKNIAPGLPLAQQTRQWKIALQGK